MLIGLIGCSTVVLYKWTGWAYQQLSQWSAHYGADNCANIWASWCEENHCHDLWSEKTTHAPAWCMSAQHMGRTAVWSYLTVVKSEQAPVRSWNEGFCQAWDQSGYVTPWLSACASVGMVGWTFSKCMPPKTFQRNSIFATFEAVSIQVCDAWLDPIWDSAQHQQQSWLRLRKDTKNIENTSIWRSCIRILFFL